MATYLEAAKIEARLVIAKIAKGRQHEELLPIAEVEDYRLAKERVKPFGVSLLTAIDEWVADRSKKAAVVAKNVPEIVEEFLTSKKVEGVSFFHMENRKYRLNTFASAFTGKIDRITTHEIEVWLNSLEVSGRTRNNCKRSAKPLYA